MNPLTYILAAGDSSWVEIIVIALFFGLSIIGSIFQKAKEKQQKDKAKKSPAQSAQKKSPKRPRTSRTVQPTRTIPPPVQAQQVQDQKAVRVAEELRLRQQRQAQLESDRKKRLASRVSPESDTNAIEARLVSVQPSQTDAADTAPRRIDEIGVIMDLETTDEARRAIILHEIFSPPKALRQGGEMWDT
ncbi:MAG: hypothetical protein QGG42_14630 [Phycisphaerae bacterium]|jgi:hypothetical protein|nr:hypothetical protein [Phycisphaerae bacterium]